MLTSLYTYSGAVSERENAKPDGLAGILFIYFVYSYAQPGVEEKDIFMNKLKHSYTYIYVRYFSNNTFQIIFNLVCGYFE